MGYIYANTMMVLCITESILGLIMLLMRVAADELNVIYRRSRYFLAAAFLCLALNGLVHGLFQPRSTSILLAVAFNIVTYYLMAILIGMAFIPLLNLTGFGRRRLKMLLARWSITSIALALSQIFKTDSQITLGVTVIGTSVFLCDTVFIARRFFRIYHSMKVHITENYTNELEVFIKYLYKSVIALIAIGTSSVVITYLPHYVIVIYTITAIIIFVYVFLSFNNYSLYVNFISSAVVDYALDNNYAREHEEIIQEETKEQIIYDKKQANARVEQFNSLIAKWIEEKRYCQSNISLNSLAADFGTNRQYLYQYLKEVRTTNFRQFVNSLRIEESKRLIKEEHKNISEAAEAVGFKSVSHFSTVFKDMVGKSPTVWSLEEQ